MKTLELSYMEMEVDREFTYTVMAAVSELHGRFCSRIGKCNDMAEASRLGNQLERIVDMYNQLEVLTASFDDRPAERLVV